MKELRLKSLQLENFRSFPEARLEFPEKGLFLLDGRNHDTGGSSGSGKTSIGVAIRYALGSAPWPATQLQGWYTDKPLRVQLGVDTPAGELVIDRGTKLKLLLNGEKHGGAAKALESKLVEVLGMTPEMLDALTCRGQRTPGGNFLSKANAEAQEFLTQLLGLHRFETAVDVSKDKQKQLLVQVEAKRMGVDAEVLAVKALAYALQAPVLADETLLSKEVAESRAEVLELAAEKDVWSLRVKKLLASKTQAVAAAGEQFRLRIEAAQAACRVTGIALEQDESEVLRLKKLLDETLTRHARVKTQDRERQQAQNLAWADLREEIANLRSRFAEKEAREKALFEVDYRIGSLETNCCPTCQQQWPKGHEQIPELKKTAEEMRAEISGLEAIPEAIESLKSKEGDLANFVADPLVEKLGEVYRRLSSELLLEEQRLENEKKGFEAKSRAEVEALKAHVGAIKLEQSESMQEAGAVADLELQKAMEQNQDADVRTVKAEAVLRVREETLRSVQSNNERLQAGYQLKVKALEGRQSTLETLRSELQAFEAELNAEQDFVALIGPTGFLGSIFDEVLDEISDETNRVLASVPNTSHVTIAFRSESVTQKGTVKKGITTVVSIGGHEAPLASGCSGGMQSTIEFAVDLAVDAVVCRRLGVSPGWLILDEPFEGLGPVEKEGCLEIMQVFAQKKLVIVVDHASEFKEYFANTVTIDYRRGLSAIAS